MAFSKAAVAVVALAVGVGLLLQTYGVFQAVEWQTGAVEKEIKFMYIDYTGPYESVAEPYGRVVEMAVVEGGPKRTFAGIYRDNPKEVAAEKLRSQIGVLAESDSDAKALKAKGLKLRTIPKGPALTTTFPFVTALGDFGQMGSFIVSAQKVYPALETFCAETSETFEDILEVYDEQNSLIRYYGIQKLNTPKSPKK